MNNYIKKALKGYKFYVKDENDGQEYCLRAGRTGGFYLIDATEEIKQILKKQQDIIKECLPEHREVAQSEILDGTDTEYIKEGWNQCRKEFLDNLKSKGINLE